MKRLAYEQFCTLYGKPGFGEIPEGLMKMHDLTGVPFGKLLAIEQVPGVANLHGILWNCRCVCSPYRWRQVWSKQLLTGLVRDCGCVKKQRTKKRRQRAKATVSACTRDSRAGKCSGAHSGHWPHE
jgi:hypothetical protein